MRHLNLVNVFLYGLTGLIWTYNGLRRGSGFYIFLGAVWLVGAVIWMVRFYKEKQKDE